jgi:hypothetical protein
VDRFAIREEHYSKVPPFLRNEHPPLHPTVNLIAFNQGCAKRALDPRVQNPRAIRPSAHVPKILRRLHDMPLDRELAENRGD